MAYDILLKNVNIYCGGGELLENKHMAISNGKIVAISDNISTDMAIRCIDCTGKMVSPGFVDTHMHIDLSYTYDFSLDVPSLIGGAGKFRSMFAKNTCDSDEVIYQEVVDRCARTIDNCLINGTTALKTNVTTFDFWKTLAIDAIIDLKERYKGLIDVYNIIDFHPQEPSEYFFESIQPYQKEMAEKGLIDYVGGYPHKHPNGKEVVDIIFDIAKEYSLPIDIHCDESDVPMLTCFEYVLDKIIATNMQGKVSFGHVTALSASMLDEKTAQRLIKKAVLAQANITSLTSCNMYLMNDSRRGPTRVRELQEAGVNVAVASDDIHEILRPYGNCDLLEEALLTAQVHKMGTTKLMRQAFDMITYNAAKNALISGYGTQVGCVADLVIIDAKSPEDAMINLSSRDFVIKNGKIVVEKGICSCFMAGA